jgi:hypothetical protein
MRHTLAGQAVRIDTVNYRDATAFFCIHMIRE